MAKTFEAPFTQMIRSESVVCTLASTTYTDTPPNAVLLYKAGPEGGLVRVLKAIPRGTITATQLQLFRAKDGTGVKRLFESLLMPAFTMSNSVQVPSLNFITKEDEPSPIAPLEELWVAVSVATASGICFSAVVEEYA